MTTNQTDEEIAVVDNDDLDFDITPATGSSYPRMEDLVGCLLLIRPYRDGTRPSTIMGSTEDYTWVETDTYVLELPKNKNGEPAWPTEFFEGEKVPFALEGFQYIGQNITPTLQRQMAKNKLSVGVLIIGEQKKRGLNKPWILDVPTDMQIRKASKFWTAYKERQAARGEQDYFG